MSSTCAICGEKSENRCAGCKRTYYCSREHQKQHWKDHKDVCKTLQTKNTKEPPKPQATETKNPNHHGFSPSQWAEGLTQKERYDWLTDCYRMRVDDDYAYGGGNLHGLYDPDADSLSIVADFLTFCKLAKKNKVIPSPWDWNEFLKVASGSIMYAFEKSDAQDKYGKENFFSVVMGGRSLRATGEIVYGSSCMMGSMNDENISISETIEESEAFCGGDFDEDKQLFADVGGVKVWEKFLTGLSSN